MTRPHLLDVNVLVALAWPHHVHHRDAREWFAETGVHAWATTPVTESGFVRISSNLAAIQNAVRPTEALDALRRVRSRPGHHFLVDDIELLFGDANVSQAVVSHRQVTDAHLVAVARRHGARLATFDRAIASLADSEDLVLIPVAG